MNAEQLSNHASGPFTAEEVEALWEVFGYMDAAEKRHYEDNPGERHIWLRVMAAKAAVERVQGENILTEGKR